MIEIKDLVDAVVAALNGAPPGTFSRPFTAVRIYEPSFDPKDLVQLQVVCMAGAYTKKRLDRGGQETAHVVHTALQQFVGKATDAAQIDPLMRLAREIADFLEDRELEGVPELVWDGQASEPIYEPELLYNDGIFMAVIGDTYREFS